MMKSLLLILLACLIVGTVLFGYFAWRDFQQATIKIEWSTASEVDTAGYNVYRSNEHDDGFVRINSSLIPASQEPLTGGRYSLDDENLVPGRIYYYVLEDIDMNGLATRHGPIEIEAKGGRIPNLLLTVLVGISALSVGIRIHKKYKLSTTLSQSATKEKEL
jgi:cell division protein FtsL